MTQYLITFRTLRLSFSPVLTEGEVETAFRVLLEAAEDKRN